MPTPRATCRRQRRAALHGSNTLPCCHAAPHARPLQFQRLPGGSCGRVGARGRALAMGAQTRACVAAALCALLASGVTVSAAAGRVPVRSAGGGPRAEGCRLPPSPPLMVDAGGCAHLFAAHQPIKSNAPLVLHAGRHPATGGWVRATGGAGRGGCRCSGTCAARGRWAGPCPRPLAVSRHRALPRRGGGRRRQVAAGAMRAASMPQRGCEGRGRAGAGRACVP